MTKLAAVGRAIDLAAVLLAEQQERHRAGRCLFCGIPLDLCWCGANEREVYEPCADGSEDVGVA